MALFNLPSVMLAKVAPDRATPPPAPHDAAPAPMHDAGEVAPPPGPQTPGDHGARPMPDGEPMAPGVGRMVTAHMGEFAFVSARRNLDNAATELDRNFRIGDAGFAPDFLAQAAADTLRGAQAVRVLGAGGTNAPAVLADAGKQMLAMAQKVSDFAANPPQGLEGGLQARDVILRMRDDIDGLKAYVDVGREKIKSANRGLTDDTTPVEPAGNPPMVTPEGTEAPPQPDRPAVR